MSLNSRKIRRVLAASGIALMTAATLAACSGGGGGDEAAGGEDCTPAHEFETLEPGTLTIATYDYPPATIIESDTVVTGFEGDLLMKFAEENCLATVVTSAGGAGAVIPSIETDRADIGAGSWYRTKERAEIVHLSYPTAIDTSAVISLDGLTADDIATGDYKVGSVSGNLWNDSVQQLIGDQFSVYQDDESIYGDLAAGRIDAIVASEISASTRFENNPIEGAQIVTITPIDGVPEFERPGQLTFPVSLNNEALATAIDESVQAWHEDGTIAALFEEYGLNPDVTVIDEVWEL